MENNRRIFGLDNPGNLFYGLNCAHLIIYIHHRHQDRVRTDRLLQLLKADMAVVIHREKRNLKSQLLQISQRIVNGRMLHCR